MTALWKGTNNSSLPASLHAVTVQFTILHLVRIFYTKCHAILVVEYG